MDRVDRALVAKIGEALGGWSLKPDPGSTWSASLSRKDGAVLWFGFYGDRVEIGGSFPRGVDHYLFQPQEQKRITCAVSKGAERIARDIRSRFFPWYLPAYADGLKRKDEADAQLEWQDRNLQELAETLGGTVSQQFNGGRDPHVHINRAGVYGHVEVNGYTKAANIELRGVPVDIAHKLLAGIKGLFDGDAG
jgi:hypothetical protein